MARRSSKPVQERELIIVPVGTPEEAEAARKRAMRILADWIKRQRAKEVQTGT